MILDPQEAILRDGEIFPPVDDADHPAADVNPNGPRVSGKIKGAIALGTLFFVHHDVM